MFPLLLSLIATPSLAVAGSLPVATPQDSDTPPAIKLWMNSGREFREGERVRVQVESRDDGYVLVFDYDTDGRLRILFPVDAREDNLVRAGRRYEVRGRDERESFVAGNAGKGVVYAAVSPDPFRLDEYQTGGHWDYSRLSVPRDARDPEAEITDLVQRMSSDRGFDYDVLTYQVYSYRDYTGGGWYPRRYPYAGWDPYYSYCDPFALWSFWSCRPYRSSLFLGFGFNYYDPFYSSYYPFSSGYSPYGYGYYPYTYGYYPYRYTYSPYGYRPSGRYPIVVGRPRGYTIGHHTFGSGSLAGGGPVLGPAGGISRPVIDSRPRGGGFEGRGRGGSRADPRESVLPTGRESAPAVRPPARRSRGGMDGGDDSRTWSRGNQGGQERGDRTRRRGESSERAVPTWEPRSESRGRVVVPESRGGDQPRYDPPARRAEDRPRFDPPARRADPAPRFDPPPRREPQSSPPPRAESPRGHDRPSSPPPSRGGGGGGDRPRGGGGGHGGGGRRGH